MGIGPSISATGFHLTKHLYSEWDGFVDRQPINCIVGSIKYRLMTDNTLLIFVEKSSVWVRDIRRFAYTISHPKNSPTIKLKEIVLIPAMVLEELDCPGYYYAPFQRIDGTYGPPGFYDKRYPEPPYYAYLTSLWNPDVRAKVSIPRRNLQVHRQVGKKRRC